MLGMLTKNTVPHMFFFQSNMFMLCMRSAEAQKKSMCAERRKTKYEKHKQ